MKRPRSPDEQSVEQVSAPPCKRRKTTSEEIQDKKIDDAGASICLKNKPQVEEVIPALENLKKLAEKISAKPPTSLAEWKVEAQKIKDEIYETIKPFLNWAKLIAFKGYCTLWLASYIKNAKSCEELAGLVEEYVTYINNPDHTEAVDQKIVKGVTQILTMLIPQIDPKRSKHPSS